MPGEERELELYPSNWLYNAGVIGFLRVLEEGLGEDKGKGEDFLSELFEDNRISLSPELFQSESLSDGVETSIEIPLIMDWYFSSFANYFSMRDKKFAEDIVKLNKGLKFLRTWLRLFHAKSGIFGAPFKADQSKENLKDFLGNEKALPSFKKIVNLVFNLEEEKMTSPGKMRCAICGKEFVQVEAVKKDLYEFSSLNSKEIGSVLSKFPNSFWNLNASMPICLTCTYMILHYPLAFTQTSDGDEIFINAPDFRLMWYLNKFVREVLEKEGTKDIRKLFGLSLMQWAMRINQTLGAWTMANIEVIRKYQVGEGRNKKTIIDHFDLPPDVVGVLMDPVAASLINSLHLWPILELVMRGKYSELLVAAYCAARAYLMEENKEIPTNHCVRKYMEEYSDKKKEKAEKIKEEKKRAGKMFQKLPLLFARIKELKEDKMGRYQDTKNLFEEGLKIGKDLKEQFKKQIFRILELTRLGKINDSYQMIMRILVSAGKEVPSELVKVLGQQDQELQKSYIYAFLSGVLGEEKEQGGE